MHRLPGVFRLLFSHAECTLQSAYRTYFQWNLHTLLSWYPLHKHPDDRHPDRLPERYPHLLLLPVSMQAQMPLATLDSDRKRSGNFHPEVPALLLHRHFQIPVLLIHGVPGDFLFHVTECKQSWYLLPSLWWFPGGSTVFWVLPYNGHPFLFRWYDKVLQLRPQISS